MTTTAAITIRGLLDFLNRFDVPVVAWTVRMGELIQTLNKIEDRRLQEIRNVQTLHPPAAVDSIKNLRKLAGLQMYAKRPTRASMSQVHLYLDKVQTELTTGSEYIALTATPVDWSESLTSMPVSKI